MSTSVEEKTYEATATTTNYGIEISAIIDSHMFCNTLQEYIGKTIQYRKVLMFIE